MYYFFGQKKREFQNLDLIFCLHFFVMFQKGSLAYIYWISIGIHFFCVQWFEVKMLVLFVDIGGNFDCLCLIKVCCVLITTEIYLQYIGVLLYCGSYIRNKSAKSWLK